MDPKAFQNPAQTYSVVMFVQDDTLQALRKDIEQFGKQKT